MSTTFKVKITPVAMTAVPISSRHAANLPITERREDSTTSAISGTGRMMLSTIWLPTIAFIGLHVMQTMTAGTIVMRRRTSTGVLKIRQSPA